MARIHPQEGELQFDAADAVLNEIGDFRVKNLLPELDHGVGLEGGDRDVTETAFAGHEAATDDLRRLGLEPRCGEELEGLSLRPDKTPEAFDAAQRRLLTRELLDRHFPGGEPLEDGGERGIAIDLPAEHKIFARAIAAR